MRRITLVAAVLIAVCALMLFGCMRPSEHKIELRAYFEDAQGLRAGAPVRVAGVDVGSVIRVRAHPELRENPAEVVMGLRTSYELKIPRDSIVSVATAGVLGPTFAEIDVTSASGEPAQNGSVLKTRKTDVLGTQDLLEKIATIVQRKPCDSETDKDPRTSGRTKERK